MNEAIEKSLTLEQKFKIQALRQDIEKLTEKQAKEYLIEQIIQSMCKDNIWKDLMRQGL